MNTVSSFVTVKDVSICATLLSNLQRTIIKLDCIVLGRFGLFLQNDAEARICIIHLLCYVNGNSAGFRII